MLQSASQLVMCHATDDAVNIAVESKAMYNNHNNDSKECKEEQIVETSALECYLELCTHHHCRPISSIRIFLNQPMHTKPNWQSSIREINFARSYVGAKGALPIIELCSILPQLEQINLSDNYLTNYTVEKLCEMAYNHPSLHSIELYDNDGITWTGAMNLANLLLHNVNITHVDVRHTNIESNVAEMLFGQCRKNARALFAQHKKNPKLSAHPTAIHLRAMKRYFHDAQHEEYKALQTKLLAEQAERNNYIEYNEGIATSATMTKTKTTTTSSSSSNALDKESIKLIVNNHKIAKEKLWDGYQECCRNLGKAVYRVKSYDDPACTNLLNRLPANVERITWEMFFILLLIENSEYSDSYVKMVRRVFDEFNVDPSSAHTKSKFKSMSSNVKLNERIAVMRYCNNNISSNTTNGTKNNYGNIAFQQNTLDDAEEVIQSEGIVEVRAFKEIYLRLFNEMPLDAELTFVRKLLGLDEENTINWDEFLFVWYMRFPSPGSRPVGVSNTPLHTPKPQMVIQQM